MSQINRRSMLTTSLAWAGAAVITGRDARAKGYVSANARPRVAAVGTGSRWSQLATGLKSNYGSAKEFRKYGDYVAVCDADANRVTLAKALIKDWTSSEPDGSADYRKVLDRDDIDIVHISTPDHWHAKILIEAMLAGKDVYCEKPMTLTIEEGQQVCEVAKKTKRVVQVGTQQRSNMNFIKAVAIVQDGRIGTVKKATCAVGGGPTSPQLPIASVPNGLDWNLWQGPVADVPFRLKAGGRNETKSWSRCHYEFRWWYEYSGGKLTDWGAHHVDCASWILGKTDTGPVSIEPIVSEHPMPFKDGYPTKDDQYNTATKFQIKCLFEDDLELEIRSDGRNGIMLEGTKGRIFVNRGTVAGRAVDALAKNPLPVGALKEAYKGLQPTNHFQNFFDCATTRKEPISDVFSHHRALTTCHLAAISARLNQQFRWDPQAERITDNAAAQSFVGRDKRKGFEVEM
ncbi:MAG: Gfo/Idh/MocA family protein [Planctomycetaceae bacterium]